MGRVKVGERWGYVSHVGKFVIEPQFDEAFDFSEGLAGAQIRGNWGFVNKDGKFEVEPIFSHVLPFSEGVATAQPAGQKIASSGFIDHNGRFVISPAFGYASRFRQGRCFVETKNEIGYIDQQGKFIWRGPFVEVGFASSLRL